LSIHYKPLNSGTEIAFIIIDNACIIGNWKRRLWVNIIGGKGKVNLKEGGCDETKNNNAYEFCIFCFTVGVWF